MSNFTSSSTPPGTPPLPTRSSTQRKRVGYGETQKAISDARKAKWSADKKFRAYSPKAVKMLGLSLKPPPAPRPGKRGTK